MLDLRPLVVPAFEPVSSVFGGRIEPVLLVDAANIPDFVQMDLVGVRRDDVVGDFEPHH